MNPADIRAFFGGGTTGEVGLFVTVIVLVTSSVLTGQGIFEACLWLYRRRRTNP